jgi:hypothetical protein
VEVGLILTRKRKEETKTGTESPHALRNPPARGPRMKPRFITVDMSPDLVRRVCPLTVVVSDDKVRPY